MPSLKAGVSFGIGLAISAIVIAALFPTAIGDIFNTTADANATKAGRQGDAANWSSLAITFFDLMGFGIPLAAFLFILGWALDVL